MSLKAILDGFNVKNKCKVGLWLEIHPDVSDEIYEALENGVPINTVYRALKLLPGGVDFSDKTFTRHITKACSC